MLSLCLLEAAALRSISQALTTTAQVSKRRLQPSLLSAVSQQKWPPCLAEVTRTPTTASRHAHASALKAKEKACV